MGKNRTKIRRGGLQRKTLLLVLVMLAATVAVFTAVSNYQNKMLARIVGETREEQQRAISQTSQETMHQVVVGTMVKITALQANIADNDFAEVVHNTAMLRTMAQGLVENRDSLIPMLPQLPDPALAGTPSAMVLCEAGVDYTQSQYLGYIAHMSSSMIAMLHNSEKIDGCYIGLADGTDLCVDEKPQMKLDENGRLLPFPVRERPWYVGAVEAGGTYFTGIEEDAFSGMLLVTCSAPVTVEGELIGVVGIDILLESMEDFMRSSAEGGSGTSFVVNEKGQVILSSAEEGLFAAERADHARDLRRLGNMELASFLDHALRENTELTVLNIDDRQYYAAGAPMPTVGWAVISLLEKEITEQPEKLMLSEYDRINDEASTKFREETALSKRNTRLMVAALILACVGAALVAAGRIVRPLEEMTNSIIESGKTGQLFAMKDCYRTNDEIQVLAESFDDLSQKTRQYIHDITEITKEKERVNTELDMANRIQSSMLPHIFPAFPNRHEFDIYATMDPAKEVGGDFYDFFLIDDDHLYTVIADVSGKGVPAALFMMISKVILQNYAVVNKSPAEILALTNAALCTDNQVEMFVTVWLGILEISTGKVIAANAGHEYPVLTQNGRFALFKDRHGFVIGGMDGVKYREYELQLKPGDKLFLYTDGVPEATDAENRMFGTERMLEALNREPGAAPEQMLKNVRAAVDGFVKDAEQFDDLTMLCLEYKGPGEIPPEKS